MVYHVFSKSIADFIIFNNATEYDRILKVIRYYKDSRPTINLARFLRGDKIQNSNPHKSIELLAYCIMPTHLHFLVEELKEKAMSSFMSNILNSYTRFFNLRHNRKGPLWQSRFKRVKVINDEQFEHLTRYIHLNPVTAYLVEKPEEWKYSSYLEYLGECVQEEVMCNCSKFLSMSPEKYKEFAESAITYQRERAATKKEEGWEPPSTS